VTVYVVWCGADEASASSRYSSTSTLCSSVVEMPVGGSAVDLPVRSDDAPPPLPPRQRRRGSSHGAAPPFDLFSSPPPLPPSPASDSMPPVIPPRSDLLPPPLPPRRSVYEHGVPPSPPVVVTRRYTGLPVRAAATTTQDGVVPQLPPKTYRLSHHVRQSSS